MAKNGVGGACFGTPTAVGGLQKEQAGTRIQKSQPERAGYGKSNRTGGPVKGD